MKGIVFTLFNQMVEEKLGLTVWDQLLQTVKPASQGAYTSSDNYNDEELVALVVELSKITQKPIPELISSFGEYTLTQFTKLYPQFFEGKNLKDFLLSIHGVVHVEVKKLYPDANLPHFTYEVLGENKLVMVYESTRKMCSLAEGLMDGAAKHYATKLSRVQTKCMHRGDPHCRFELTMGE